MPSKWQAENCCWAGNRRPAWWWPKRRPQPPVRWRKSSTSKRETSGEVVEPEPLTDWSDWPRCPQCGQRRAARCPVCGVSRVDFLLADVQESPTESRVLLKCDDCDDLMRPQWYRRCAACGFDY